MKAWVLHGIDDIRLEEVEKPQPGEREVLVEVKAAGICGSDIPRIYQNGTYSYPLIPGHEFSGMVAETGTLADPSWKGKRVGVFPLIPCGKCAPCRKKKYEMCRSYSYLGSRQDGGFAEYALVPEDNLICLPEHVSYEAAAMLEPMAVAVHSMRRAAPAAGDRVAVCGLGTIGLLLMMFLREAGVRDISVIGNKEPQRQSILEMGFTEESYCDCRQQDAGEWLMKRTGGDGVDVFFECVGRNETLIQAVQGVAPAGKVMLVGNPYSDMALERNVYWKILRNQLTVLGTWNSSFTHEPEDDWHYVLEKLSKKLVMPEGLITHRHSFDGLEEGLHIMRDKSEDYVKVMAVQASPSER